MVCGALTAATATATATARGSIDSLRIEEPEDEAVQRDDM